MSFHDLPPMASVTRAASLKEVKGRGQTGTSVDRNYQRKALEPGEPLKWIVSMLFKWLERDAYKLLQQWHTMN